MIDRLLADTRAFIAQHLAEMHKPAVACSFGKDSMVMLALVREQKPDVDVVYFNAFPSPTKHAFAMQVANDWKLNLHCPTPLGRDLIGKGDHVKILELHLLAPNRAMAFPMEAEPGYEPDADCHCAIAKLNEPVADCQLDFDGVFIGHRNDDVDPTQSAVPLASDAVIYPDFRYLYPLKDWTEADIWHATNLLEIPQNWARYSQNEMAANNDYYPLCTRCLSSDVPVTCPKTQQDIPGVRAQLGLDANRMAWRSAFINLAA